MTKMVEMKYEEMSVVRLLGKWQSNAYKSLSSGFGVVWWENVTPDAVESFLQLGGVPDVLTMAEKKDGKTGFFNDVAELH